MTGRIRSAFGRVKGTIQRLTKGSQEFLIGELGKVKKYSKWIAGEVAALFVLAIVAAIALSSLIQSFVFDLLMPFLGLVSPEGNWRKLRIRVGETYFNIGNFLGNLVFFVVVVLIALLIVKTMPKRPGIDLRQLVRTCPTCGGFLPPGADECEKCGTKLLDFSKEE